MTTAGKAVNVIRGAEHPEWLVEAAFPFESQYIENEMTAAVKTAMAANLIRGTKRSEWLPETMFPYESWYIEIGGSQIHYVDTGRGPIILFLHSNGVCSILHRDMIRGLRDSAEFGGD
ncbi:MAG: hypothetical protein V3U32_02945 [Anaerolineales bacterium]